jgi:hypothetical protein
MPSAQVVDEPGPPAGWRQVGVQLLRERQVGVAGQMVRAGRRAAAVELPEQQVVDEQARRQ